MYFSTKFVTLCHNNNNIIWWYCNSLVLLVFQVKTKKKENKKDIIVYSKNIVKKKKKIKYIKGVVPLVFDIINRVSSRQVLLSKYAWCIRISGLYNVAHLSYQRSLPIWFSDPSILRSATVIRLIWSISNPLAGGYCGILGTNDTVIRIYAQIKSINS